MQNVIDVVDRNGIKISCSKTQWETHIIEGHPIMEKNIDAIEKTITDPDYVFRSHDSNGPYDDRRVYSREVSSATYHEKTPFTRVVVSVDGGYGSVITAFNARTPRGEKDRETLYVAKRKSSI